MMSTSESWVRTTEALVDLIYNSVLEGDANLKLGETNLRVFHLFNEMKQKLKYDFL